MKPGRGSRLIPFAPLKLARCPRSLAATLAALPSMSLIPFAPFSFSASRHSPFFRSIGSTEVNEGIQVQIKTFVLFVSFC
jgi:hypothetical protein